MVTLAPPIMELEDPAADLVIMIIEGELRRCEILPLFHRGQREGATFVLSSCDYLPRQV